VSADASLNQTGAPAVSSSNGTVIDCLIHTLHYGAFLALRDVQIPIQKGTITAFIGPSGCGKSTALRCLNRMNDLVRGFRFDGRVLLGGQDIYDPWVSPHLPYNPQRRNPMMMQDFLRGIRCRSQPPIRPALDTSISVPPSSATAAGRAAWSTPPT
jgi:energy-coupling factor transporter ATP-binding protein EcfA2